MLPAHERLRRHRLTARRVDDRLVVNAAAARARAPGVARSRCEALRRPGRARSHRRARNAPGRVSWRGTSRRRRRAAARRGVLGTARRAAMPMLAVKKCSPLAEDNWLADGVADALGQLDHMAHPVRTLAHDQRTRLRSGARSCRSAERLLRRAASASSTSSPAVMAERVVDDLEAIEIEQEHRHVGAVTPAPGEGAVDAVERQRAVRQPGEGVMQRRVPCGLLLALALHGRREHVGDRDEEVHVVGAEAPSAGCKGAAARQMVARGPRSRRSCR